MICNKNYLADILRFCEIKDLIWVVRFQSSLVYICPRRGPQMVQQLFTLAAYSIPMVIRNISLNM